MKIALVPQGDRVLVELVEQYESIATVDGKYDTKTSGICLAIGEYLDDSETKKLVGKQIFWEQYKDGEHILLDGKKYAFIKIGDVDGYRSDGESS